MTRLMLKTIILAKKKKKLCGLQLHIYNVLYFVIIINP
jgi:hypothetical protein